MRSRKVVDLIECSTRYDLVVGACLSASLQWSAGSIGLSCGSESTGKPIRIAGASCDQEDHRGTVDGVLWDRTTRKPRKGDPVVFCRVSPYAIARSFGFNGIPKPGLLVVD
jgi:diaminopimelate decarboxylase